jgi:hypothetical protein
MLMVYNDIGYDNVFAREVEAVRGDLLIAISTSGKSESVNSVARLGQGWQSASWERTAVGAHLVDVAIIILAG